MANEPDNKTSIIGIGMTFGAGMGVAVGTGVGLAVGAALSVQANR